MRALFLILTLLVSGLSTTTHASPSNSPIEWLMKLGTPQEINPTGIPVSKKLIKHVKHLKKHSHATTRIAKARGQASISKMSMHDPRFLEWVNGCIKNKRDCVVQPYHEKLTTSVPRWCLEDFK